MNPTMGQLESVKTYNALIHEGSLKGFLEKGNYGGYYLSECSRKKLAVNKYSRFIFQLSKATVFVEAKTGLGVHSTDLDGMPMWRPVDEDIPAPEKATEENAINPKEWADADANEKEEDAIRCPKCACVFIPMWLRSSRARALETTCACGEKILKT